MELKVPKPLETLAKDEGILLNVIGIRMAQAVRWAQQQRQAWHELNVSLLAEPTEPAAEVAFPEDLRLAA